MENRRILNSSHASPSSALPDGRSKLLDLNRLLRAAGLLAIGLLWLSAPAPAQAQVGCAHDICEVGDPLSPQQCGDCVTDICRFDPYCCQTEWDDYCVEKVLTECRDWTCAAACSHSPCETGEALDNACESCVAYVCFEDPTCCNDKWDSTCTGLVQNLCGYQCKPGEDACANALPVYSGTTFGTLIGSTNDGCDTGNTSCRSGDVWYTYTHVVDQEFRISTCKTERSFGIDTVVSVHEGCPGIKNNEIRSNDDFKLGLVPDACNDADPNYFLDSALPVGGVFGLQIGQTVVIRVSHHDDSTRGNFELRILPEPEIWLSLVAGAGALGALSRRRTRR